MFAMSSGGSTAGGARRRPLDRLREKLSEGLVDEAGEPLFRQIAEQIVNRRLELRLSQAELASLCDTTQSAIARVESGGRPPRIDTLLRIANALDCELEIGLRPRTRRRGTSS